MLQGLPGAGPGKAGALPDRFGRVAAVVNATHEDLGALDGFGPKGVHAIPLALH